MNSSNFSMKKEIYTNGNLTIPTVAALLGTNRTYVSNVINNEFGFSFYQFVNKYRIQKATILFIQHPDMQIQEVASLSGFNSLSSFISAFKLNEGITPKQWKQRYVDAFNNFEYVKLWNSYKSRPKKVKL